ncbi:MAG: hypothetical protein RIS70_4108 [Planctomycetota bacterium]
MSGYPPNPGDRLSINPDLSGEVVQASVVSRSSSVALQPPKQRPRFLARIAMRIASTWEWCFGIVSLLVGLAILASIPIFSFLSLGYLLEVSGRVARTGRFWQGLIGVRKAARVGSMVLGTWLMMVPLRTLADLWYSSQMISATSWQTRLMRGLLVIAIAFMTLHLLWAWFRGGRLRHFFWPAPLPFLRRIRQGGLYREATDRLWEFVVGLRLPYYFWLGLRGFVGATVWLLPPMLIMIAAVTVGGGGGILLGLTGGVMLAVVVFYLTFLEAHFACERRFMAMFEVRQVRHAFRRAPIAFWFALLISLASALPLYLLKIELTPRQAVWLPSLVFVGFIAPSRLIAGWALARAAKREQPRNFVLRWGARLAELPVIAAYTLIVFLTPFVTWNGKWGLLEQHAFLLPIPFFGN